LQGKSEQISTVNNDKKNENNFRVKRNERKQLCTFAKVLSVTHRGSIGVRRPHRDWIFVYFSHRRATNRQRRVASVSRHAESIYDPRWFASACAIFSAPAARPPPRESIGDPIHHPPGVVPS
jgi:Holliday junction resolvase